MAYQALYRQWRPQTFSAMVGQEAVNCHPAQPDYDGTNRPCVFVLRFQGNGENLHGQDYGPGHQLPCSCAG